MYMMSMMTVMMMNPVVAVESTLTSVQIQQDVASVCLCSMPSVSLGIDVSPSPYRSFFHIHVVFCSPFAATNVIGGSLQPSVLK